MSRETMLARGVEPNRLWDIIVIGGGATGIGIAVDAASRGFEVLLLEQSDFGAGTSSRSTKLIHGGVRYLRQGNIRLVRESLDERSLLLRKASHVVSDLPFIIPCENRWDQWQYSLGLKFYDWLTPDRAFGRSHVVSKTELKERLPNIQADRFRKGVLYHDGQFDDCQLLIDLMVTAAMHGAACLNYARVVALQKDASGALRGVDFEDRETLKTYSVQSKCVINAAGPYVDRLRQLDEPDHLPLVKASQGIHLVLPKHFLGGSTAIIVPKTADGRVMFVIPWHDHVLIGTTDTPLSKIPEEPQAMDEEIQFLLDTARDYLETAPTRADCLSVFAGIRPLVSQPNALQPNSQRTSKLSRDHFIERSSSGLITISGGKWTTYRKMAEDCVDTAIRTTGLPSAKCASRTISIVNTRAIMRVAHNRVESGTALPQSSESIFENPSEQRLHPELPYTKSDIVRGIEYEMGRTVVDLLARRTRALFLNARAAIAMAPAVANIAAHILHRDQLWQNNQLELFREYAKRFQIETAVSSHSIHSSHATHSSHSSHS